MARWLLPIGIIGGEPSTSATGNTGSGRIASLRRERSQKRFAFAASSTTTYPWLERLGIRPANCRSTLTSLVFGSAMEPRRRRRSLVRTPRFSRRWSAPATASHLSELGLWCTALVAPVTHEARRRAG